jgi:hypothetical protein
VTRMPPLANNSDADGDFDETEKGRDWMHVRANRT